MNQGKVRLSTVLAPDLRQRLAVLAAQRSLNLCDLLEEAIILYLVFGEPGSVAIAREQLKEDAA